MDQILYISQFLIIYLIFIKEVLIIMYIIIIFITIFNI